MSELCIALPAEIEGLLKQGCRGCYFARNLLWETINNGLDPHPEVERINNECMSWQGEVTPRKDIINASEGPALALSTSIKEHCTHPLS